MIATCGSFELDEVRSEDPDLVEAYGCLLDAFEDGDPAELQVALMTDEGDPIVETYRVVGERELELMVDTRQDQHGSTTFYYAVCTELADAEPGTGPTVRPGDGDDDEQRTFPPSAGAP